jgi:nitrate/TMAO reductase-like tetraheme cytochrome c subunit
MNADLQKPLPKFSLLRNWLSLLGLVVTLGSLFSFVLLEVMDLVSAEKNDYVGILTFVVCPMFLVAGMVLMGLGWLMQRRFMIKSATGEPPPFLMIDLSRPRDRRNLTVFLFGGLVFMLFAAVGSYNSYHFSESVMFCGQLCHPPMKPEFTAYQNSPHAKVECTACHVGSGATSFVKAKLNGVHQLYGMLSGTYHRPIKTPVKNMRSAHEICEECHWKQKYVGDLDRTYVHFLSDDENTRVSTRLTVKVGGGDPTHGPVGGIHWHMNLANKVEYVATDEQRQVIPWVRLTDAKGQVTEFRTAKFQGTPSPESIRQVDCLDCHNRPAHQFRSPNDAVDNAMRLGRIDPSFKAIKKNAVAVLAQTYTNQTVALTKIESTLRAAYGKGTNVDATIAAVVGIYTNNFFPAMQVSWKAYPDNIGHKDWPGCFRCHDGLHKAADGKRKIEASDCNACHLIMAQSKGKEAPASSTTGIKFAHPDSASEGTDADCTTCHSGGP